MQRPAPFLDGAAPGIHEASEEALGRSLAQADAEEGGASQETRVRQRRDGGQRHSLFLGTQGPVSGGNLQRPEF